MRYIVGLGNPGKEYENTRHNVGFEFLKNFIVEQALPSLYPSGKYEALVSEGVCEGEEVTILLPQTFMNLSGTSVRKMVPQDETDKLIVVYDDIDLPLGSVKVSFGRGDGGHNGVRSIIESMKTQDFARLRIGVAQKSMWTGKLKRPKGSDLSGFLLNTFSSKEQKELTTVFSTANEALKTFIVKGKEAAMNQFN